MSTENLKTKKVLFVDDEDYILEIYEAYFADSFAVIDTAQDGQKALDKIINGQYDLVVSDIRMPDYDGFYLLEQLKLQDKLTMPLIFISGYSEHSREELLALGATDFFEKPCELDKLMLYFKSLF